MKQNFDFHLHTNYSDGEHSIPELLEILKNKEIKYFSITDHDNVDSIKEIQKYNLDNLCYIPGIEISSILDKKYKMHILGYGIDPNNEELMKVVTNLKMARVKRFYEMAEILYIKFGIKIEKEELEKVIEVTPIPGKAHLAKLLIEKGYGSNVSEMFEEYLDNIKTTISNRIDAGTAISAINAAGGRAIWAHPKKVEKEYHIDFKELIPRLIELGLEGIEVGNSLHSYNDYKRYMDFSKENNLLISAGSDFHGYNIKPNVLIGEVYNTDDKIEIGIKEINIFNKIIENKKNNFYK